MKNNRKALYIPELLIGIVIFSVLLLLAMSFVNFVTNTKVSAQNLQQPSPELARQRQETIRLLALERKQEELEKQSQLELLEKENSVYEITYIQSNQNPDLHIDLRLYTLRHRKNNTEYLLVITPEGSSITPISQ